MTSIPTKARRAALPSAIAVVIAITAAALFGGQITPPPRAIARMRARRLLKAIIRAMTDEPNPMTIEQAIARAYARTAAPAPS